MLHKAQEGVQGGTLAGGSPFLFSSLWTCAPIRWEVVDGLSCDSTPFLWCLPKETVSSRQRKALFYLGGSTIRVSAAASVDGTFLARLGEGVGGLPGAQVSLTQSAVMLGLRVRGRGGWDQPATVAAPISAFLWGSTPFLCARAKKWGGTGSRGHKLPPKKTAHPHQAPDQHQPLPKVGRGTSRLPTGSAHATGGAARVKKRLSLAARHRFFGQAPKKWGRIAGQAIDHLPTYRRTRTKRRKQEGGTPGEGSPWTKLSFALRAALTGRRYSGGRRRGLLRCAYTRPRARGPWRTPGPSRAARCRGRSPP